MACYELEMEEMNRFMKENEKNPFINPAWLPYYSIPLDENKQVYDKQFINNLKKFADK